MVLSPVVIMKSLLPAVQNAPPAGGAGDPVTRN